MMKRIYTLALCAVMLLSLAACAAANTAGSGSGESGSEVNGGAGAYIANPFVDYKTLDDAAKAAGFALTAPETVEGLDGEKIIQVASGTMIQVIFQDGADNRLFIRKEPGKSDISGDYNSYAKEYTAAVGSYSVTFKGNDDKVCTAVWTSGGYSYAVMSDVPMPADTMTALIAQIA